MTDIVIIESSLYVGAKARVADSCSLLNTERNSEITACLARSLAYYIHTLLLFNRGNCGHGVRSSYRFSVYQEDRVELLPSAINYENDWMQLPGSITSRNLGFSINNIVMRKNE